MNTKARKSVLAFLLSAAAVLLVVPVALLIYDPLMLFHRPWGRELTFSPNMRLQAAGIIKHFTFDSVIIGTSMLQNTSGREARSLLGGRFVNLSMEASTPAERSIILRRVFEQKKDIRAVIFSVDTYNNIENPQYPTEQFSYLYDRNPLNDIRAYYSTKYLICLVAWSSSRECVGRAGIPEMPVPWYRSKAHSSRFGGLDNWFKAKNNRQVRGSFRQIVSAASEIQLGTQITYTDGTLSSIADAGRSYFDTYVLDLVRAHPDTTFHLVFPPFSRMRYASWYQRNARSAISHQAVIRHLAAAQDDLPNLRVYGYEHHDFLDDIANYKDTGHYHQAINSMMLRSIKDGSDRITKNNVEWYLAVSQKRAMEYDLVQIGHRIHEYLRTGK